MMPINKETIIKFDKPGPRYTSYPTAPQWTEKVTSQEYSRILKGFGQSHKTLSLYVHIPFCKSMCTFCACNVLIRPSSAKYADEYLTYLFKEIDLLTQSIGERVKVKQLHWGGGTPTFLTDGQMEALMEKLRDCFDIDFDEEVAIEIDPRTINSKKLKLIKDLGFNRVSMGVQDFDDRVQQRINRIQPFNMVKEAYDTCRTLKFSSINFDLIYGLPAQTINEFEVTVARVISLKPDRIALYSFAYVPWLKKHQTKIDPKSLPTTDEKLDIFLHARKMFLNNDYDAIAMDHFALKDDELAKSFKAGKLYRNFMGYTVKPADEYLGLGLTSIGFLDNTFIQNEKVLAQYYGALNEGKLPIERGKILSEDDSVRQWTINALMCRFSVDKNEFKSRFDIAFERYFDVEKLHLEACVADGLIVDSKERVTVTDSGKIFIRNVCMGFDYYLRQQGSATQFSRTV